MLIYLGICAVISFVVAAAALSGVSPVPTFDVTGSGDPVTMPALSSVAAFHIAFALGAMPLVFGAIIHFVPVLTRSNAPHPAIRALPVAAQIAGLLAVLALAGVVPWVVLHPAATLAAAAASILAAWIVRRMKKTLGAPHPGARWYVATLLALLLALLAVPPLAAVPELRLPLRLWHLHLNTLGFIGLAALGTLPVLLPTALGRPEPTTAARLRGDLRLAVGGVLLVAVGAAFHIGTTLAGVRWFLVAVAAVGAALLAAVLLRDLLAWRRAYGMATLLADGAVAHLLAATGGLLMLLAAGIAHGAGLVEARPAIAAYALIFLLPLVSGALTQLLPVWRHPGVATPARATMRARLAAGGRWRAVLFLAAGAIMPFHEVAALTCAGTGLAWFCIAVLRARPR